MYAFPDVYLFYLSHYDHRPIVAIETNTLWIFFVQSFCKYIMGKILCDIFYHVQYGNKVVAFTYLIWYIGISLESSEWNIQQARLNTNMYHDISKLMFRDMIYPHAISALLILYFRK